MKYISVSGDRRELYNLKTDPEESINLINEYLIVPDYMASKFSDFEENCKIFEQESVHIELDKEKLEELKSLGYMQ